MINSAAGYGVLQFFAHQHKVASPDAVDRHVGARIRRQRTLVGLGQERLAEILGVTLQQIQNYESGDSRIGAGRLPLIARALGVPITFFFERQAATMDEKSMMKDLQALFATCEGIAPARAFARIQSASMRRALIATAQAVAGKGA